MDRDGLHFGNASIRGFNGEEEKASKKPAKVEKRLAKSYGYPKAESAKATVSKNGRKPQTALHLSQRASRHRLLSCGDSASTDSDHWSGLADPKRPALYRKESMSPAEKMKCASNHSTRLLQGKGLQFSESLPKSQRELFQTEHSYSTEYARDNQREETKPTTSPQKEANYELRSPTEPAAAELEELFTVTTVKSSKFFSDQAYDRESDADFFAEQDRYYSSAANDKISRSDHRLSNRAKIEQKPRLHKSDHIPIENPKNTRSSNNRGRRDREHRSRKDDDARSAVSRTSRRSTRDGRHENKRHSASTLSRRYRESDESTISSSRHRQSQRRKRRDDDATSVRSSTSYRKPSRRSDGDSVSVVSSRTSMTSRSRGRSVSSRSSRRRSDCSVTSASSRRASSVSALRKVSTRCPPVTNQMRAPRVLNEDDMSESWSDGKSQSGKSHSGDRERSRKSPRSSRRSQSLRAARSKPRSDSSVTSGRSRRHRSASAQSRRSRRSDDRSVVSSRSNKRTLYRKTSRPDNGADVGKARRNRSEEKLEHSVGSGGLDLEELDDEIQNAFTNEPVQRDSPKRGVVRNKSLVGKMKAMALRGMLLGSSFHGKEDRSKSDQSNNSSSASKRSFMKRGSSSKSMFKSSSARNLFRNDADDVLSIDDKANSASRFTRMMKRGFQQ